MWTAGPVPRGAVQSKVALVCALQLTDPRVFSSVGYYGRVASKNLWWSNGADRFGGVSVETGKGMQVMTGTNWFQGQASPIRDTLTKIANNSYLDVFAMQTGGKWSTVAANRCTKTSNRTIDAT